MALVNVVNMTVLDNPTCFLNPFQFEITFECLQELDDDLEWKVLYVGSAHDSKYDQILDEILVGPIPVGMNKFVLQADAPNIVQLLQQPNITSDDILGVTVVLVTCSYKEREFVRIGYYVNNEYHIGDNDHTRNDQNDMVDITATTTTPPTNAASTITSPTATTTTTTLDPNTTTATTPPTPPLRPKISIHDIQFDQVQRQILADKPRVTKFPIPWNLSTTTTNTTTTGMTMTNSTTSTSNNSNNTFGGMPLPPPIPIPQHHQESNQKPSQPHLSSTPSTIGTNTEDEMMMMMDTEESS